VLEPADNTSAVRSVLSVRTKPSGAEVWVDGIKQGVSPLEITSLNPAVSHKISLQKKGYYAINEVFKFSEKGTAHIHVALKKDVQEEDEQAASEDAADSAPAESDYPAPPSEKPSSPKPRPARPVSDVSGAGGKGCAGSGSKLSLMPQGVADCQVTVGSTVMGVAPFFKKDAPVGKCAVTVTCPDGRTKEFQMELLPGKEEKLIIKPTDW
jgi:hypothetical protein